MIKKINLILKNSYRLLIVLIIIISIFVYKYLYKNVYETISSSAQIVSIFKKDFLIPIINEEDFNLIKDNLKLKYASKEIKWDEVKNPFE